MSMLSDAAAPPPGGTPPRTLFQALNSAVADRGDAPAVTYVNAETDARVELGFTTLGNWVHKTANLLADALSLEPGDEVSVTGPLHWTAPVIILAAWACGAGVRSDPGGRIVTTHESSGEDADIVLGDGIAGRPLGDVNGAFTVTEILAEPDDFAELGDESRWAIGGRTQGSLLGEPHSGERVLVTGDLISSETLFTVAATLPHGVSLVLAVNHDAEALDRLVRIEGVTDWASMRG